MKIDRKKLDEYVEHYRKEVRATAVKDKWQPAELAAALATAEERVRKVLKGKGLSLPRARKK